MNSIQEAFIAGMVLGGILTFGVCAFALYIKRL
jgi:hypothetical protein